MSFGGEGSEILEDPTERHLRLERQRRKQQEAPTLTSVVQVLPDLVTQETRQWQDHVIEPMFEQQKGQHWWVKLPGATTLVRVEILDVTPKTVRLEQKNLYFQPARYARSDIEFVEQIHA